MTGISKEHNVKTVLLHNVACTDRNIMYSAPQMPPWLASCQHRPMHPLPQPAELIHTVTQRVLGWAATRVRTDGDLEKLLAADALEDERAWRRLDEEEAEVKVEVAEMVWEELMADTAEVMLELERVCA